MRLHTVVKDLFALDLLLVGISLPPKVLMLREKLDRSPLHQAQSSNVELLSASGAI